MSNEIEAEEYTPLPPKQSYGWRILLSVSTLLVLIGATVFFLAHPFNQNIVRSANPVPDLPTTIHWQRVQSDVFLPKLVAAPSNPAILYICSHLGMHSGPGFSFARSTDAGVH